MNQFIQSPKQYILSENKAIHSSLKITLQQNKVFRKYRISFFQNFKKNFVLSYRFWNWEGFQFRWVKIKGNDATFPISITLFSNNLRRKMSIGLQWCGWLYDGDSFEKNKLSSRSVTNIDDIFELARFKWKTMVGKMSTKSLNLVSF